MGETRRNPCGPELLAPAGDRASLVAAVQNGADAVYLGAKAFNARAGAENFGTADLAWAIEYAHVRDVKVYVTVNTLIADREMEDVVRLLQFLYNQGADGVIIQDLGLARLARLTLPQLPLHASTQMTVHNLPGVRLLEELGFQRVVLARELNRDQIVAIRRGTRLELEVFIHGALCVCYSGQCLFSSMVGGRSGNRGRCAQPCRLPYTLVRDNRILNPEDKGYYLLSPRDLNLSQHLPDVLATGVHALKIEGRLRRAEYVATVVRIYRRLIDRAMAGNFYVTPEETGELAQIFNRRFSTGYFYGRLGPGLMNYKQPNNRGVFLGRVQAYDPRAKVAAVKVERALSVGDGVDFWVTEGGRISTEVRELYANGRSVVRVPAGAVAHVPVQGPIRPGDRVFKIWDEELLRRARATFTSSREQKKIPLTAHVVGRPGEPLRVTVSDPAGRAVTVETAVRAEPAAKCPLTKEFLAEHLGRLGNTPFDLADLECNLEDDLIVPVREINELRRRAIGLLAARKADESRPVPVPDATLEERVKQAGLALPKVRLQPAQPILAVAAGNIDVLKAAVAAGAERIYFPGEGLGSARPVTTEVIKEAANLCRQAGTELVFWTPRIVHDHEIDRCLEHARVACREGAAGFLSANLGLLALLREEDLPLYADLPLNVFNVQTVVILAQLGVNQVTLSPELTLGQVGHLVRHAPLPVEVVAHGAVQIMVTEYCVAGGLTGGKGCSQVCRGVPLALRDRRGVDFPVAFDRACRMHIFNSKDLCMLDHLGDLLATGVVSLRLDLRLKTPAYATKIVNAYRRAREKAVNGRDGVSEEEWRQVSALSPGGITRGHYFRGVL